MTDSVHFAFHAPIEGYLQEDATGLQLQLRTLSSWTLHKVQIRCEPDNEEYLFAMQKSHTQGVWQYWRGHIPRSTHQLNTFYVFKLVTDTQQFWLDAVGLSHFMPGSERHFKWAHNPITPAWLPSQIFYQIFPDRFYNGDPSISVKTGEYLVRGRPTVAKNWGEAITIEECDNAFFGGDLGGIQKKLDYLEQLGVTAVYLNPIFESPSNHKYDTTNFLRIDPHLGTHQQFAHLCDDIHKRGMRLLLDGVFNHVSVDHPWFNKNQHHPEAGAYQGPHSTYYDYFTFKEADNPDSYSAWKGFKSLPVLNFAIPAVQASMYSEQASIIRYWLKPPYQIDGWRLDVIHMLGEGAGAVNNHQYVAAIAQAILDENPQAYVLGEHFYEATPWLQGDQEQGAMNYYGFAHPVRAFLAGQDIAYDPIYISAAQFAQWLNQARAKLPFHIQLNQFNLIDSHDTARFLTLVQEDYNRMYMAVALLFCYPGIPSIYYGDEIGLTGGTDPYCRSCFNWDQSTWQQELWDFYHTCIQLRKNSPVLQTGAYMDLLASEDVFAFARFSTTQSVICIINRGKSCKIHLPLWQLGYTAFTMHPVLHSAGVSTDGTTTLSLPAHSHAIFTLQPKDINRV